MDHRSFDRLARILGGASDRRTGLKALVGGLLGAGTLAALDADADAKRTGRGKDRGPDAGRRKKKKKKCNPACEVGFACVKGRCTCASGIACNGACCGSGQVCRDGACADPLPACLAFGAECKDTGRRCCDGLTCASGQDGSYPVTCLKAKGASCERTAECPFGMTCTDGRCLGGGGGSVPTGAACSGGETCAQPGATCSAYTTAGAPAGEFCTLPLRKVCTGNPDCSCYNCWYVNDGVQPDGRHGREAASVKACVQPKNAGCATTADCALGLTCTGGVCTGTAQCAPGGAPCGGGVACCSGTCTGGVCSGGGGGGKQIGDACTSTSECPANSTCTVSSDPAKSGEGTKCLLNDGQTSATAANCKGNGLHDGTCVTCTLYYTTGDDAGSFNALKTALQAAAAAPDNTAKNPVYVGAGTYKFTNPDQFTNALVLESPSLTTTVKIFACDSNNRPVFDGGSTVSLATTTTVPTGSEWSGGQGLLYLTYTSPADYNTGAGYEIDGIDFVNGRNTSSGSSAGAVASENPLTLSNSTIDRCYGVSGGIHSLWTTTLKNVTVTQCYGSDTGFNMGGAMYVQNNVTLEDVTVLYNGAASATNGAVTMSCGTGEVVTLKGKVEVKNNVPNGLVTAGTGGTVNCTAVTSPAGNICGNPASGATGETNCGGTATFTGCSTVCKGTPKDTTANGGVC